MCSSDLLQKGYAVLLRGVLKLRWVVIPAYLAATIGSVVVVGRQLGTEIFPAADAGQMALRLRAPAGTRLDRTEQYALRVLDIIRREAGEANVLLTMGLVGVHAPNYPINLIHLWNSGPEEAHLSVQLKPDPDRPIAALQERLRAAFETEVPDLRVSFEPSDIVSRVMSFGSPTPIEIAVSGPSLAANREFVGKIRSALAAVPALRDIQMAQTLDFPSVDVNVNRERAGLMGVRVGDVTRSLVAATTSSRFTVPNYWADPNSGVSYSLQVQIPQARMNDLEEVRNIPVTAGPGRSVLLRNLATVTPGTAVGQYERYNMARVVSLTANIHGSDLGRVVAEVEAAIATAGEPPPKTSVALRGQSVPMKDLLLGFRHGLLVSVLVIALLLAANFQSLRLTLAVLFTLPAAVLGVLLALHLTHTTLNIQSAMGAIMSVGVAVANAILLMTFSERFRREGMGATEAAVEGARSRLRPVLMTSLAMIAGMMPMALGLGEGGAQSAPLGRAVVGGLCLATLATLLVLPAVFGALSAGAGRRSGSLDPTDPESEHYAPPAGA